MRLKHAALVEALTGNFDEYHAELAHILLGQIDQLTAQIGRLSTGVEAILTPRQRSHTTVRVLQVEVSRQ